MAKVTKTKKGIRVRGSLKEIYASLLLFWKGKGNANVDGEIVDIETDDRKKLSLKKQLIEDLASKLSICSEDVFQIVHFNNRLYILAVLPHNVLVNAKDDLMEWFRGFSKITRDIKVFNFPIFISTKFNDIEILAVDAPSSFETDKEPSYDTFISSVVDTIIRHMGRAILDYRSAINEISLRIHALAQAVIDEVSDFHDINFESFDSLPELKKRLTLSGKDSKLKA